MASGRERDVVQAEHFIGPRVKQALDNHISQSNAQVPRGLWLAREMPFPQNTGDRIYTAQLANALSEAGCDLTFVGFPAIEGEAMPDWAIQWISVPGRRKGRLRSLLSTMPHVAASHATSAYRTLVAKLAKQRWDFIVVDQYGMGWAFPILKVHAPGVRLAYISHDHETSVTKLIYQKYQGSFWRRILYWQNHLKTARIEDRIARSADLLTMISTADAQTFTAQVAGIRTVVLTPGYAAPHGPPRTIDTLTPKRVLMVGSYHWIAKQENLKRFVETAEASFVSHGIELHVIGSMPDDLSASLRSKFKCIRLHGFVDDLAPHFRASRIAAVSEDIGGGFKLKFLDYALNRVPIVTLTHAAEGIPPDLLAATATAPNIGSLVQAIVSLTQEFDKLNVMQESAFTAARAGFDWRDRGRAFLAALLDKRESTSQMIRSTR